MTVYSGQMSHKASKHHKTGELRFLEGATDNNQFGQIFGINGHAGNISSNNKVSMIDLFPQKGANTIYVDPTELTQIDDLTFLRKNVNSISNWVVASNFLEKHYQSMLIIFLRDVAPLEKYGETTNEVRKEVTKLALGVGEKQRVLDALENRNDDQVLKDTIGRYVLGNRRAMIATSLGLTLTGEVKTTKFEIIPEKRVVKVYFSIEDFSLNGSMSDIKGTEFGKENIQNQRKIFSYLREKAKNISEEIEPVTLDKYLVRQHSYSEEQTALEIAEKVQYRIDRDFEDINKVINKHLVNISIESTGATEEPAFNLAKVINELWSELGLPKTEITATNLDTESVASYANKKITARQFLEMNKEVFKGKFKHALKKRFAGDDCVSYDSYVERAVELSKDDLRSVSTETLIEQAKKLVVQVIAEYVQQIENENDVDSLFRLYLTSNRTHDTKIINALNNQLKTTIGTILSNSGSNKELKKDVEREVYLHLSTVAVSQWHLFLQANYISYGTELDAKLHVKYMEKNADRIINDIFATSNHLNKNNVQDFVGTYIQNSLQDISNWYAENYDYEQANEVVKKQLISMLKDDAEYGRASTNNFWEKNVTQALKNFKISKNFQNKESLPLYVETYANDWEANIESFSKSSEKGITFYKETIEKLLRAEVISQGATRFYNLPEKTTMHIEKTIDQSLGEIMESMTKDVKIKLKSTNGKYQDVIHDWIENHKTEFLSSFNFQVNWNKVKEEVLEVLGEKLAGEVSISTNEAISFIKQKTHSNEILNIEVSDLIRQYESSRKLVSVDKLDGAYEQLRQVLHTKIVDLKRSLLLEAEKQGINTNIDSHIIDGLQESITGKINQSITLSLDTLYETFKECFFKVGLTVDEVTNAEETVTNWLENYLPKLKATFNQDMNWNGVRKNYRKFLVDQCIRYSDFKISEQEVEEYIDKSSNGNIFQVSRNDVLLKLREKYYADDISEVLAIFDRLVKVQLMPRLEIEKRKAGLEEGKIPSNVAKAIDTVETAEIEKLMLNLKQNMKIGKIIKRNGSYEESIQVWLSNVSDRFVVRASMIPWGNLREEVYESLGENLAQALGLTRREADIIIKANVNRENIFKVDVNALKDMYSSQKEAEGKKESTFSDTMSEYIHSEWEDFKKRNLISQIELKNVQNGSDFVTSILEREANEAEDDFNYAVKDCSELTALKYLKVNFSYEYLSSRYWERDLERMLEREKELLVEKIIEEGKLQNVSRSYLTQILTSNEIDVRKVFKGELSTQDFLDLHVISNMN